ncbi:MAG TPA: tetratricopeptide repeat protein [Sphingomonas sp.]|nr:tetratricopeptide repeat protein [Sphingomonas sp.]
MASTAERGQTRWVRRGRRRWRIPARGLRRGGALLAATALLIAAALGIRHWRNAPDPSEARAQIGEALKLYALGNMSGARAEAAKALRNDPDWGLAHALAARLDLALGDGDAAEAELDRAKATGFDSRRLHQLYAEAQLLQDDPDAAIAEADRAPPRYADYATRVKARALAASGDLPSARQLMGVLVERRPDYADAWTDLARLRLQSGDVAGASAAAERALALDRRSAPALTLEGELVRDRYGLVAALPWFDAALKIDPGNPDTLLDKAATLGDLGRYEDMLDATRRALAARPGDPMAYYLQAVLAARAGRDDLARDLLQRTGGALDDMPGALLLRGALAYRDGADQQAADAWGALVGDQPLNLTARRLLGAARLSAGDADDALEALRPLALRSDADTYTLTLVARAFEAEGKRDWAATFLDRAASPMRPSPTPFGIDDDLSGLAAAAEAAPGDPVAALALIRGLLEAGQNGSALAHAQMLADASPGSPEAEVVLGDTLWAINRVPEAAAAYRRAANLRFDEPVMLRLVEALDRTGRREAAQRALALFLSQNPADVPARRLAANWQIAAKDWDAAIDTLEGLRATLGNRDAAVLGQLALAYAERGDADIGRRYGAAAYRLAPMTPAVVDAFGWALAKAGSRDGARQLLVKAASLAPGDPGIRAHLKSLSPE